MRMTMRMRRQRILKSKQVLNVLPAAVLPLLLAFARSARTYLFIPVFTGTLCTFGMLSQILHSACVLHVSVDTHVCLRARVGCINAFNFGSSRLRIFLLLVCHWRIC